MTLTRIADNRYRVAEDAARFLAPIFTLKGWKWARPSVSAQDPRSYDVPNEEDIVLTILSLITDIERGHKVASTGRILVRESDFGSRYEISLVLGHGNLELVQEVEASV